MCFKKVNKSISSSDLPDIVLPILEEEEEVNPLNTAFDDTDDDSDNEMPELEEFIPAERTSVSFYANQQSFEMNAMALFGSSRNWYTMLLASWTTEDCDDSVSMRDIRKYTTIYSITKKLNIVGFPKFTFGKAMEAYLTDRTAPEPFWT